jgi:hypothetical protein
MVLQIFPEPSTSSINADSYTVPTASKQYKVVKNFDAAVYTVTTSPNTSEATVQFDTGSSFEQTVTVSGTVTYNLASSASSAILTTNTGSNVVVTITKVAAALSGAEASGTLDTITSTGTYNQTGKLYVLAVGGGGGGGADWAPHASGGGGGAGAIAHGVFYVNTSTSVTIGSAGNGGTTPYGDGGGNSGGTTNFGNLLSAAGGNSPISHTGPQGNTPGVGQTGASFGGGGGTAPSGNAVANPRLTIGPGTNGGGGGGGLVSNSRNASVGAGSGIGTGGTGSNWSEGNGGNANGYGAGGGGAGGGNAGATQRNGGNGSQGVVYVLRGF